MALAPRPQWRSGQVTALVLVVGALAFASTGCENGRKLAESQQTKTITVAPTATATQTVTQPPLVTAEPPSSPSTTKHPPASKPTKPTSKPPISKPPTSPPDGTEIHPLALGTFHRLGSDFRVTVAQVIPNANRIIADANQFNDPPKGQYALAWINAQYIGHETGSPWIDLRITYFGTDRRQYNSDACGAVVPVDAFGQPDLSPGGHSRFQVCWDLPPSAIAGGKIAVEETFAFEDTRRFWRSR